MAFGSSDQEDLINEMKRNYPKWIAEGLTKSTTMKNIEKALNKMAGMTAKTSSALSQQEKIIKNVNEELSEFDKIAGKTNETFDDIIDSAKGVNDAQNDLKKALGSSTKALFEKVGLAAGSIGLISQTISHFGNLIAMNMTAYSKLADAGFRIESGFTGISRAAIKANLNLTDFAQLAMSNASALAEMGQGSADFIASLSAGYRLGEKTRKQMSAFGMTIDDVNDFLTSYVQIQQSMGMLNKKDYALQSMAFSEFISDVTEFSDVVGYSRKELVDSLKKTMTGTQWVAFTQAIGNAGPMINKAFEKTSGTLTAISGPELGGKLSSLMQDFVMSGGAVSKENQQFLSALQQMNPELLQLVENYSNNIRAGKVESINRKELTKQLLEATKATRTDIAWNLKRSGIYGDEIDAIIGSSSKVQNVLNTIAEDFGGDINAYLEARAARDADNASVQSAVGVFNEALTSARNTLELGFITALGLNKDNLIKVSEYISSHVVPRLEEFVKWMGSIVDDPSKFTDAMGNIIGEILVKAVWGTVKYLAKLIVEGLGGFIGVLINPFHPVKNFKGGVKKVDKVIDWASSEKSAERSAAPIVAAPLSKAPPSVKIASQSKRESDIRKQIHGTYGEAVLAAAQRYGVRAELLESMIYQESRGDPYALSPKGARGLLQFMPETAREYGINPYDPIQAIDGAARYMRDLQRQFGGNEAAALAAYNEGPGNYKKGRMPLETQNYQSQVLARAATPLEQPTATAPVTTEGSAAAPVTTEGSAAVSVLSAQFKEMNEKLSMIAMNTGASNNHMRKISYDLKNGVNAL